MRLKDGQAGAEIKITPAMIEAGLEVYAEGNPDLMRPSDIVLGIFKAMLQAKDETMSETVLLNA
jgi:hypothetical protein